MAFPSFLKKTKKQILAEQENILKQVSDAEKERYQKIFAAKFADVKHLINYYTSILKKENNSWAWLPASEKQERLFSLIDKSDEIKPQKLLEELRLQHEQKAKENLSKKANNPKPFTDQDFYIKNKYSPEELDYYVTKELELDPKSVLHPTEQFVSDDKIQKVIDDYIEREWQREVDALDQKEKFEASINYPVKLNFRIPNKIQKFDVRKRQKSKTLEAMLDRVLAEGAKIRGTSEDFDADIPINLVTTKRKGRWNRVSYDELTKDEKKDIIDKIPKERLFYTKTVRHPEYEKDLSNAKRLAFWGGKPFTEAQGRRIRKAFEDLKLPTIKQVKAINQQTIDDVLLRSTARKTRNNISNDWEFDYYLDELNRTE